MDELIEQLTGKLGIDASTAKSLTGKTMQVVKDNVGGEIFSKITGSIPGVGDLIASAASDGTQPSSGGGLLGKLASSVFGQQAGGGLELGALLAAAGLTGEKGGDFVKMIIDFVRQKAGNEVIEQVLAKFPMLKTLIQ